MDSLTLDDVNGAIKRHLQTKDLTIAIATGAAATLRDAIAGEAPSPITYPSPKSTEILEQDKVIQAYPLGIPAEKIEVIPVDQIFAKGSR
jgi:zinc protease